MERSNDACESPKKKRSILVNLRMEVRANTDQIRKHRHSVNARPDLKFLLFSKINSDYLKWRI